MSKNWWIVALVYIVFGHLLQLQHFNTQCEATFGNGFKTTEILGLFYCTDPQTGIILSLNNTAMSLKAIDKNLDESAKTE